MRLCMNAMHRGLVCKRVSSSQRDSYIIFFCIASVYKIRIYCVWYKQREWTAATASFRWVVNVTQHGRTMLDKHTSYKWCIMNVDLSGFCIDCNLIVCIIRRMFLGAANPKKNAFVDTDCIRKTISCGPLTVCDLSKRAMSCMVYIS